jgi:hypothetical protein
MRQIDHAISSAIHEAALIIDGWTRLTTDQRERFRRDFQPQHVKLWLTVPKA